MLQLLKKVYSQQALSEKEREELLAADYVRKVGTNLTLKPKGLQLLEEDISGIVATNLNKYRQLFAGLKPGSIGSKQLVKDNLTWFLHTYPEYSIDDIFKAAEYHISNGGFHNSTVTIRRADYFIRKRIIINEIRTEVSDLLTVLEEMALNTPTSSSWRTTLI